MTPHEWDVLALVLSVAALVTCVRLGWVWGRARLRADLVPDLNRRLDAAYDEGWDDAVSAQTRQGLAAAQGASDAARSDYGPADEAATVLIPAGVRSGEQRAVGLPDVQELPAGLSGDAVTSADDEWAAQLHEMNEQLHQDLPGFGPGEPVKAGNLPGPQVGFGAERVGESRLGAGEPHYGEAPLPAVLGLGQEFSGDDRTYERSEFRRWQFCQKVGIAYRPVGLGSIEAA